MKILPSGVAVIGGDSHISKWVEQHGTLAIAEDMLKPFKKYVPEGTTVVDVGANIGDHTVTYSRWVGDSGWVMAFEPYVPTYNCLVYNTRNMANVLPINKGLSDDHSIVGVISNDNVGATYLTPQSLGAITSTLDYYEFSKVSFIKIDVEGYETKVLRGAKVTTAKYRPVMLIEVNYAALVRAGSCVRELFDLISSMDYMIEMTDPRIDWLEPQYDILCKPMERVCQA